MSTSTPYPPIKQHFERVLNELEKSKTTTDETEKELITEYGKILKKEFKEIGNPDEIARDIDVILFAFIDSYNGDLDYYKGVIHELREIRDMFFIIAEKKKEVENKCKQQ